MSAKEAAMSLKQGEEEEEFFEQLFIITRMGIDEAFEKAV